MSNKFFYQDQDIDEILESDLKCFVKTTAENFYIDGNAVSYPKRYPFTSGSLEDAYPAFSVFATKGSIPTLGVRGRVSLFGPKSYRLDFIRKFIQKEHEIWEGFEDYAYIPSGRYMYAALVGAGGGGGSSKGLESGAGGGSGGFALFRIDTEAVSNLYFTVGDSGYCDGNGNAGTKGGGTRMLLEGDDYLICEGGAGGSNGRNGGGMGSGITLTGTLPSYVKLLSSISGAKGGGATSGGSAFASRTLEYDTEYFVPGDTSNRLTIGGGGGSKGSGGGGGGGGSAFAAGGNGGGGKGLTGGKGAGGGGGSFKFGSWNWGGVGGGAEVRLYW